jgi:hypothetical protein
MPLLVGWLTVNLTCSVYLVISQCKGWGLSILYSKVDEWLKDKQVEECYIAPIKTIVILFFFPAVLMFFAIMACIIFVGLIVWALSFYWNLLISLISKK